MAGRRLSRAKPTAVAVVLGEHRDDLVERQQPGEPHRQHVDVVDLGLELGVEVPQQPRRAPRRRRRWRGGRRSRTSRPRCAAKKPSSSAVDSAASTPATTSGRWLSRRSRTTSQSEPTAPSLSSYAPKTRRSTRASTRAPAHIVHGSRVTTRVQPVSRHSPRAAAAARRATTSACPVGSPSASRVLRPVPMTAPVSSSTTAPTGYVVTGERGLRLGQGQAHRARPSVSGVLMQR